MAGWERGLQKNTATEAPNILRQGLFRIRMIKVALVKGGRSNQKKETESNSKLAVVEMKKAAKQCG